MTNPTQHYFMREQRRNEWQNNRHELDPYYTRNKRFAEEMAVNCAHLIILILFLTLIGWAVTIDTTPPADLEGIAISQRLQSDPTYNHFTGGRK